MATITYKGKAAVTGIPGTLDVIVYPVKQSGNASHAFEKEVIKDENGTDCFKAARNEMVNVSFKMKLLGTTAANAIAGSALLAPFATVTLSAFSVTAFNGTYCYDGDQTIDLSNTAVGDLDIKLVRYVDSTTNTLMTTTPS